MSTAVDLPVGESANMFLIICLNIHAHIAMDTNTSGLKRQQLTILQTITLKVI